jgi:excisionase family DNA binding protein
MPTADIGSGMNNAATTTPDMHRDGSVLNDSEILTVADVARFLRVPKSTVYKLARLGQLPASKIGKHWRFVRRDIQAWMHVRSRQR